MFGIYSLPCQHPSLKNAPVLRLGKRMVSRNSVDETAFNKAAILPFELRLKDFELAMQDIYDFFHDVNTALTGKGLQRLDDTLRPAIMSGLLSDMLTASLAKHSRTLTENRYFNGHPDLIVKGVYADDSVKSGMEGVEIKTTRKSGGAVDTPRRARSMDVRLRLQHRRRIATGKIQASDDVHRGLSRQGHARRFS